MVKVKRILQVAAICMCMVGGVGISSVKCEAGNVEQFAEARMTYISSYGTSLTISDSGQAIINGQVSGKIHGR